MRNVGMTFLERKIRLPDLGDHVTFVAEATQYDSAVIRVTGEIRAVTHILDSEDVEHLQYLVRRKDGSSVTVGEPVWKLEPLSKEET